MIAYLFPDWTIEFMKDHSTLIIWIGVWTLCGIGLFLFFAYDETPEGINYDNYEE